MVVATVVAWLVAASYSAAGLALLLGASPRSYPIDLRLRWIEHRLTYQAQNPQTAGHPDHELPASHEGMRTLGGSYPPWSYTLGMALIPPLQWRWTVAYFWGLNVIALVTLALWAFWRLRSVDARLATLAAAIPLTNFAAAICVSYGQYGVLVAGLLVGSAIALRRGESVAAGVLLALALVKPQLSAPFVLGLACQGRLATPAIAAGAAGVAWLAMAWWVDTPALQLLNAAAAESSYFHYLSHNPLTRWLTPAIGRLPTILILAVAGAAAVAAYAFRRRESGDPFDLLAVAAVVAMFWSYRRHYDVALMSIPLVHALGGAARSGSPWQWGIFLAAGITLWLPVRHTMWEAPWVQGSTLIVWLALLLSIWVTSSPRYGPPVRYAFSPGVDLREWWTSVTRRPVRGGS
jgi:hypothetical protein